MNKNKLYQLKNSDKAVVFSAQKSKRTIMFAPTVRRKFGPNTKSSTAGWLCRVAINRREFWLVVEVVVEVVEVPDNKVLQQ